MIAAGKSSHRCRCWTEQHKCNCACHLPTDPFETAMFFVVVFSFSVPFIYVLWQLSHP